MINKSQSTKAPSSLKEYIKLRSTVLKEDMKEAIEEKEHEMHKQVLQTKIDAKQNYDIDGVSMDSEGVRVATDETSPNKTR